jgi:hypothetical protein
VPATPVEYVCHVPSLFQNTMEIDGGAVVIPFVTVFHTSRIACMRNACDGISVRGAAAISTF